MLQQGIPTLLYVRGSENKPHLVLQKFLKRQPKVELCLGEVFATSSKLIPHEWREGKKTCMNYNMKNHCSKKN
ncbi:hypothetical protein Syun_019524 [Stephania yunnanensis]|uniref:Uncharacterized protein n=1 Tax=Stephania yunnanensis TaxID=152371 RepID=A0AAP0IWA3_9MAGN